MSLFETLGAASCAVLVSWLLTFQVRRFALSRSLLDVPNARSSHRVPTPRGGGLAIGAVAVAGISLAAATGLLVWPVAAAALGGGALVAWAGWLDDRGGVPVRVRALIHLLAAIWALWWLGGLTRMSYGGGMLFMGPIGTVAAAFGIVWCINLFNFMDGIDGMAAGEALSVGLFGAVLLWLWGDRGLVSFALALACGSAGFLIWNWAPARIFMGDVGSGLLGYLFAVLAVASERAGGMPLMAWALLLAVFLFDAKVTLARRLLRGERAYEAHRKHAYQRAVQAGWSHARVSTGVLVINTVLALLAAAAWYRPWLLVPALLAAVALLTLLYRAIERMQPMYPPVPLPPRPAVQQGPLPPAQV